MRVYRMLIMWNRFFLRVLLYSLKSQKGWNGNIEVQNFGQVSSQKASVKIEYKKEGKMIKVASAAVPALKPYEKADIRFATKADFEKGEDYNFLVTIMPARKFSLLSV